MEICLNILNNVAIYIEYLPFESQQNQWVLVIQELETLLRHLELFMNKAFDYTCLFLIMKSLLKVTSIANCKVIEISSYRFKIGFKQSFNFSQF